MKKVSVVLGSGGARGITQIGVLQYLQENNYIIDEVVGCSIGSLIGGAFAEGKLDELAFWMGRLTKAEVFKLMDFSNPKFGLLKGTKVLTTLQQVFEDVNIENLPISYTAVATDLVKEEQVLFRSGSIYNAIRASIAIPAVFKGVEQDDRFLVDGGVLNPLPINHVQKKDNIVIAVNLDGLPVLEEQINYKSCNSVNILLESYRVMRRQLSMLAVEIYKPDYLIDVPHNISGIWDFDRSDMLIKRGYDLAKEVMENQKIEADIL